MSAAVPSPSLCWDGMLLVRARVDELASTSVPVLLCGATGTGKEVIAKYIHAASLRSKQKFVPVNCAAVAESVLEDELFGHVKGAFTGADRDRIGLFQAADKGTLFLDEIGDTSPGMQAKLLRALQEGEVRRVGATEVHKVDVRIIAATNRPLDKLMEEGKFRSDLYYRLGERVDIPPLKDRREAIPILARRFTVEEGRSLRNREFSLSSKALDELMAYEYPGNIRQLQSVIRSAVIRTGDGETIEPERLPEMVRRQALPFPVPPASAPSRAMLLERIGVSLPGFNQLEDMARRAALILAENLVAGIEAAKRVSEETRIDRGAGLEEFREASREAGGALFNGLEVSESWYALEPLAYALAIAMRWDLAANHQGRPVRKATLADIYSGTFEKRERDLSRLYRRILELVLAKLS